MAMCRGAPTLDRYDGDKMSIRLAYDTTVPFGFKWDLAHRSRHDNDMFKTGRYGGRMARHAVMCLTSKHIVRMYDMGHRRRMGMTVPC